MPFVKVFPIQQNSLKTMTRIQRFILTLLDRRCADFQGAVLKWMFVAERDAILARHMNIIKQETGRTYQNICSCFDCPHDVSWGDSYVNVFSPKINLDNFPVKEKKKGVKFQWIQSYFKFPDISTFRRLVFKNASQRKHSLMIHVFELKTNPSIVSEFHWW